MVVSVFSQTSSLVTHIKKPLVASITKTCTLLSYSAVKVRDSQAYRNIDMSRENISDTIIQEIWCRSKETHQHFSGAKAC